MSAEAAPAAATLPIQSRETFTCPTWCTVQHDRATLVSWEYGQWLVRHEGAWATWMTSRGTELKARLTWTEIVGSSPIIVEGHLDLVGPYIEFDGDDGSGYMGVNELVVADWAAWNQQLDQLARQAVSSS